MVDWELLFVWLEYGETAEGISKVVGLPFQSFHCEVVVHDLLSHPHELLVHEQVQSLVEYHHKICPYVERYQPLR